MVKLLKRLTIDAGSEEASCEEFEKIATATSDIDYELSNQGLLLVYKETLVENNTSELSFLSYQAEINQSELIDIPVWSINHKQIYSCESQVKNGACYQSWMKKGILIAL